MSFKAQFFFSLLGLFLAILTYYVLSGIDQFHSMRSLSIIARLQNAALSLLIWLPLVGAVILFKLPRIFRRIAAFLLLPIVAILVWLIRESLSSALWCYGSLTGMTENLVASSVLLIFCFVIVYFGLLMFFSPQKKSLK